MENPLLTQKFNMKAVLFWGIIIGGLILTFLFRTELTVWASGLFNQATSGVDTQGIIGQVTGYIREKPLESLIAVGSVAGTVFGFYETMQARKAVNKTKEVEIAKLQSELISNGKIGEANALVEQYKSQALELQKKINDDTLQTQLMESQQIVTRKIQDIRARDETINTLKALNIEQALELKKPLKIP